MSNALAIGAVTGVLKLLLENELTRRGIPDGKGGTSTPNVTVLPPSPDSSVGEGSKKDRLNLFLYQITPNTGWRNVDLPSRNGNGNRLTNPPLAVDLHYLLTAYSQESFHAEIMLGYAMQLLHETPVLPREVIRDALRRSGNPLSASDLADQIEQIKITPAPMGMEEMSKLWSSIQTQYRPSVAYHVSVVLIESRAAARSPLPVLTIGRPEPASGREAGVLAQPNLLPPFPTLMEAVLPNNQFAVRMGEQLTLRGHHLDGEQVTVQFTHIQSSRTLRLPATRLTSDTIEVQLPSDPAVGSVGVDSSENPDNWQIGVYNVAGIIRRSGEDRLTNELPVVLAPLREVTVTQINAREVRLDVICRPKVWTTQQVSLIVGDREIPAAPIVEKTNSLTFKAADLAKGMQWIRLRVDGVDSILVDRTQPLPRFESSQGETIP